MSSVYSGKQKDMVQMWCRREECSRVMGWQQRTYWGWGCTEHTVVVYYSTVGSI